MDRSAEKRFHGRTTTIEPTSQHETLPLNPTKSYPSGGRSGGEHHRAAEDQPPIAANSSRQARIDRLPVLERSTAGAARANERGPRAAHGPELETAIAPSHPTTSRSCDQHCLDNMVASERDLAHDESSAVTTRCRQGSSSSAMDLAIGRNPSVPDSAETPSLYR